MIHVGSQKSNVCETKRKRRSILFTQSLPQLILLSSCCGLGLLNNNNGVEAFGMTQTNTSPSFSTMFNKATGALDLASIAADIPIVDTNQNFDNDYASLDMTNKDDTTTTKTVTPNVGVLLLNLGGPETQEDVEAFLYNLFADPDIIRLPGPLSPLQSSIAKFISKRRAPKSREAYNSIGGGSPILKYSKDQAKLLEESLLDKYGLNVKTYIGMRYWKPFTEEALEEIRNDDINALVIVPLYPQFSISTSGSSLRVLQEEFAKKPELYKDMSHTVVPSWYERPGYVQCMASLIQKELDSFTDEELEMGNQEKHILFSAHGVPKSYIEAGDPYQEQIKECVSKIASALPSEEDGVHVHLSYQSRVGPVEWLRPYTDDVLNDLGKVKKVKNLVVVPISFVSEHIETLEEIDMEYREVAEEAGIVNWRRAPALNTDPLFIDDLSDMVKTALEEPAQSVTEVCVANNCGNVEEESLVQGMIENKAADTTEGAERFNGRLAMLGVGGTILTEMLSGKSFLHMFGM
eukprot:CAMPEP_0178958430 /NCGR_PEP_ID=MMETSP0789-20121207/11617_1 /TAXON_ID=3005 /ORGANISM="Rhizosolenia setigera, Strain CCMP 1694" /LENGTH=519 /DNA_ID=CAMNT_0020641093 /DNA_START=41 /DNA_END=1600 /DNA_ORIENTATION=+